MCLSTSRSRLSPGWDSPTSSGSTIITRRPGSDSISLSGSFLSAAMVSRRSLVRFSEALKWHFPVGVLCDALVGVEASHHLLAANENVASHASEAGPSLNP